ncbi:tumor necrosis factor receptor superfamily member 14-like [Parambassis ranga]|uniref:Tumor necrosis factor receptor superfamily member 14-like n=1 Tax=Parambassis ranga TaxID=210632 RepID=A0A6P7IV15_9TELE|nr:tumor necrosis factor receptor superfamily member 14-like [Parambassis ranga]
MSVRTSDDPSEAQAAPQNVLITDVSFCVAVVIIISVHLLLCWTTTCHPTEYQIGSQCCPMCSAGARVEIDCSDFRTTSCLPCIVGTYMDNPTGRTWCYSCTNCDAVSGLKVNSSCTVTSDAVCEPMEGFYCTDTKGNSCEAAQRHTSCKPGQYIREEGTAYRDKECSDCSDGTFSDGTLTSCQPHRQCEAEKLQLIKAGTPSDDAQCGETATNGAVAVGVITIVLVVLGICGVTIYTVHISYIKIKAERSGKIKKLYLDNTNVSIE